MTRQEAIEQLEVLKIALLTMYEDKCNAEAIEMAINSLKVDEMYSLEEEHADEFISKKVIDDIKTKIEDEEDFAYSDFDAYNEEILRFDDTDICERDLCHIGLGRAIQIIDKHISGKGSRHDKKRSNRNN